MIVALLFLSALGIVLLAVAVLAIWRQLRIARYTLIPFSAIEHSQCGRDCIAAPIISVPTSSGETLTIGGLSRDPRLLMLLFIEAGSPLCEAVVGDAIELCTALDVRLLLMGKGKWEDYTSLLSGYALSPDDIVLNYAMDEDFHVGPLPAAALIDSTGRLLARGMVQRRAQMQFLLTKVTSI